MKTDRRLRTTDAKKLNNGLYLTLGMTIHRFYEDSFTADLLYAVEHAIAMEQMRGKWASSCVDFGYTELFCIPELTSEFLSSCDSVLGYSLVFYQENQGF